MQVTEYRVVHEENYGITKLKATHTYETSYDNRPSCEYLSYMLDEIYDLSYCNEEYLQLISSFASISYLHHLLQGFHLDDYEHKQNVLLLIIIRM